MSFHTVESRSVTKMGHSVKYQKERWLLNLIVFSEVQHVGVTREA